MEGDEQRCEECNSTLTYIKLKTNERVCRHCGHIQKLKREEQKDG